MKACRGYEEATKALNRAQNSGNRRKIAEATKRQTEAYSKMRSLANKMAKGQ